MSATRSSVRPGARARATSRVVRAARASPSTRLTSRSTASSSAADAPRGPAPVAGSGRRASASSGSSRNRVERLSSGALTSKYGFSVVAPIRVSVPSSTAGRRASCWDLLNRWTSSRNRIVPRSCSASRRRASAIASRTSLTPAVTADRATNALAVAPAISRARVVLPVPGGPQRITDDSRSASIRARRGRPGRQQVVLADDLVERLWPHPGGQRRLAGQAIVEGGREQGVGVGHLPPGYEPAGGRAGCGPRAAGGAVPWGGRTAGAPGRGAPGRGWWRAGRTGRRDPRWPVSPLATLANADGYRSASHPETAHGWHPQARPSAGDPLERRPSPADAFQSGQTFAPTPSAVAAVAHSHLRQRERRTASHQPGDPESQRPGPPAMATGPRRQPSDRSDVVGSPARPGAGRASRQRTASAAPRQPGP